MAAPQTAAHRSSGMVSALSTAPMAQGEKMSHSMVWTELGLSAIAAPCPSAATRSASGRISETVTRAPSLRRWPTRAMPTLPMPLTTMCRPASDGPPHSRSATAYMAWRTPHAVAGDGSPEPPLSWLTPVAYRVTVRIMSMSAVVVPTSSAVM